MEKSTNKYNVGIIAAGEGSRLKEEGVEVTKPLIKLNGKPIIERIIETVCRNGADSIVVIINENSGDLEEYFKHLNISQPVKLIVKSTESSFHSFYNISKYLSPPFLFTTADSVFNEEEYKSFLKFAFNNNNSDAVMAVTEYVDDEKPLYTEVDNKHKIINFKDEAKGSKYVTGGLYFLNRDIKSEAEEALHNGVSRLRNFFRFLVKKGLTFSAYPFSKIIDVDHLSDIKEAKNFLDQRL